MIIKTKYNIDGKLLNEIIKFFIVEYCIELFNNADDYNE